jgi:hypothetical protein
MKKRKTGRAQTSRHIRKDRRNEVIMVKERKTEENKAINQGKRKMKDEMERRKESKEEEEERRIESRKKRNNQQTDIKNNNISISRYLYQDVLLMKVSYKILLS